MLFYGNGSNGGFPSTALVLETPAPFLRLSMSAHDLKAITLVCAASTLSGQGIPMAVKSCRTDCSCGKRASSFFASFFSATTSLHRAMPCRFPEDIFHPGAYRKKSHN